MKTPDYLSYDRYKKKKKKDNSKNNAVTFVVTFFATLLFFTIVAKSLSPDVDVTIGSDSGTDTKETGLGVKKFIDERLKMIQMDDNAAGVSTNVDTKKASNYDNRGFNTFSQETEEQINLPTKKDQNNEADIEDDEPVQSTRNAPPRPTGRDLATPFSSPSPSSSSNSKTSKVLVGRYATLEQAKVAQGILLDSGLNITPFVKDMGGSYTLQVGSYSSRTKAEGLASELQRNNFPARIIQE